MGQENCYVYYKCCFILSVDVGLFKSTDLSVMIDLSQHKIMLAIPAPRLICIYSEAGYFCQVAHALWQAVGELFLQVCCVSRDAGSQILIIIIIIIIIISVIGRVCVLVELQLLSETLTHN
jgi:hypothetical protein